MTVPPPITVHLRAADGATFDLLVPAPVIPPRVRVATVRAYGVQASFMWDGTKWVAA